MSRWSRRRVSAVLGLGLLALAACTGKRNAVPLVRQVEFVPLADGEAHPLALAEWMQAFPVDGVDVRLEPRYSPRLPPVDLAILESDELERLREAISEPRADGEAPPALPGNMKFLYEQVRVPTSPEAPPAIRWRAHVVRTDRGFSTHGATASVKFPSRKDDYGGLQVFLSDDDAQRFLELTTEYDGQRIAIAVDDRALSVPVVNEPIAGGEVMITPGGDSPGERAAEMEMLFRELTGG